MEKRKYEHLFISGVDPEIQAQRTYAAIAFINGKTFEGFNDYNIYWVGDRPYGAYGTKKWGEISHGPHTHKYPELLIHLGTDPDHPFDLGAEIEMCMGEEMEKYTFNRSTVICIPPNFVHAPWRILKVTRPFLMIEINQSTIRTEKSRKDLVSPEDLKRMLFVDVGYDSDEMIVHWPEAAGPRPQKKPSK
ncbi:MAG: hypothetical protein N2506_02510 [Dehalococcoidales bacterium]|nr:hypothetical protein [Dehalococcoidales bacterium]